MSLRSAFQASHWVVVRAPLLSFESFVQLTADGPTPAEELTRLRLAFQAPRTRVALEVASPGLAERARAAGFFDPTRTHDHSAALEELSLPLYRYLSRMSWRCTPFGLFASTTVGTIVRTPSKFHFASLRQAKVSAHPLLTATLRRANEAVGGSNETSFHYRLNSSVYEWRGRLRYAEYPRGTGATASVVEVAMTEKLRSVLTLFAANERASLLDVMSQGNLSEKYVRSLVRCGILVEDIFPSPTAADPATDARARWRETFGEVATPFDASIAEAAECAQRLEATLAGDEASPVPLAASHIDLRREGTIEVNTAIPDAVLHALDALNRCVTLYPDSELRRFREEFLGRFGSEFVPLAVALDPDHGIPFGEPGVPQSAWVRGLPLRSRDSADYVRWNAQTEARLGWLLDATRSHASIDLLDGRPLPHAPSLSPPEGFIVLAQILAAGSASLERGDFRAILRGVAAPSGLQVFGRFCGDDERLRALVVEHAQREAALCPDVIFADICHEPSSKPDGNLLQRPPLRPYEIVYRGVPGYPRQRRLALEELMVSVRADRIVLWSRTHQKEVRVRNMNTHSRRLNHLPIYAFLLSLSQVDASLAPQWDWGPLDQSAWLPRVSAGPVILSPERWRIAASEVESATDYRAGVDTLRKKRSLPRWVVPRFGDQGSPLDLESDLGARAFIHSLRGVAAEYTSIEECLPWTVDLCADDGKERFAHELVIPFLRKAVSATERVAPVVIDGSRTFPPRSEWTFVKAYCAPTLTETVVNALASMLEGWRSEGLLRQWYFVRYSDPDFHIRFRFSLNSSARHLEDAFLERCAALHAEGTIWKVQSDTYAPEWERYGGAAGIDVFHAFSTMDSQVVATGFKALPPNLDTRLVGSILCLDRYATALRLTDDERIELFGASERALSERVGGGAASRRELGKRFRSRAPTLERVLETTVGTPWEALGGAADAASLTFHKTWTAAESAIERSRNMVIASLFHMHVNRYIGTSDATLELIVYDSLLRLYRKRAGRLRHAREDTNT